MRVVELGLAGILSSDSDYSVFQADIACFKILLLGKLGKKPVDNKRSVYKGF